MANWATKQLNRAVEAGKASTRGFISSRINSAVGGVKDSVISVSSLVKSTLGTEKGEGTEGLFGVIKETAGSVKNTLFSENRGIFNFRKASVNPFNSEGFLNPFRLARRAAAGVTEITADAVGGITGIISERIGNTIKGIIRGSSRAVGGAVLGDYGYYMDYEASKTNAGQRGLDIAGEAVKKATEKE